MSIVIVAVLLSTSALCQGISGKVGYVDIDYVLTQLPEMKAMQERLVETEKKLQADYDAKKLAFQQEYNNAAAQFQSLPDSGKMKLAARMKQLQDELEAFPQDANRTIENTKKLYMAPVYLRMGNAIATVAIENGYTVLVPTIVNNQDFVLWADKRLDASDLVVKALTTPPPVEEKKSPGKQ